MKPESDLLNHEHHCDAFAHYAAVAGHAIALVELEPALTLHWICPGHLEKRLGKLPDTQALFAAARGEHQETLANFWDVVRQGSDARRELQLATPQGDRWFRIHAMHGQYPGSNTPFLVLNLEDIDSELAGEQEKIERRRKETIQSMAAGIAHEFNNYLTPIRGFIELTLDLMEEDDPSRDGLRTALSQAEACAELVKQIMFSSSKSLLNLRKVNLATLLSNMICDAVHVLEIDTDLIHIEPHIDEDVPFLWIDHEMFRQAIRHLLQNAVVAMPDGGTLSVTCRGQNPDGGDEEFVLIEIADTGEGIPPQHLNKIFDPFFTTRNRAQARGMGLTMVQGMVTQMGGWIEIESMPGLGTKVTMHLPTVPPGHKPEKSGSPRDVEGGRPAGSAPCGRMLVADDEDYVLKLITRVFTKEGWEITESTSNYEVLNAVETHPDRYDVLILDVSMPGPSAEETLQRIRATGCKAHILLVSGLPASERIQNLVDLCNGVYISKPFSLSNLLDRVENLMRT